MLSQIVRPLVQTQIRLLANSQATRSTLIETICRWLGYLGVRAQVTQLMPEANQIQVSLTVGQPDTCDPKDWQKILQNLRQTPILDNYSGDRYTHMNLSQQTQLARFLAYLIQVGNPELTSDWEMLKSRLSYLSLDDSLLQSIRAALKVPQAGEQLIEKLQPDVAAIALPIAVSIALLDRQINPLENQAITALLCVIQ